MQPIDKQIAAKLQNYPENKLTKEIIIPLLEKMGYHKVEFFGGPDEDGKDIVFWEKDKFDKVKLSVAQVKHFKLTNRASDNQSLQGVVNQLINCFSNKLPYTDKTFHKPHEVFLFTTYEVDTKSMLKRFSENRSIDEERLKIIGGKELVDLLIKHKPELIKDLIGVNFEITSKLKSVLNNKSLLTALGYRKNKDIKTIYTDIDFSLGKNSTKLFFTSLFNPKVIKLQLKKDEWDLFKTLCYQIEKEFPLSFLNSSLENLDESNKSRLFDWNAWKQNVDALKLQAIESKYDLSTLTKKLKDKEEEIKLFESSVPFSDLPAIKKANKESYSTLDKLSTLKAKQDRLCLRQDTEIISLNKKEPRLLYHFQVNGQQLASAIMSKRNWIEEKITFYNSNKPDSHELKMFIEKCKSIIDAAALIFSHNALLECIGYEEGKIIRLSLDSTRFKMPLDQVFDTGVNVIVLGEAGAGKTTSLQMYAEHRQENNSKLIIPIPLAHAIQNYIKQGMNSEQNADFEECIATYLNQMGIPISIEEFKYTLTKENIILLLDGLDEAIKSAPWLTNKIALLSEKHKSNVQIIVSSRTSGGYVNDIPFLTVTLLPFTLEQRNKFIEKWFGEEEKEVIGKIKKHLSENNAISDIVKNPLLITTLCVLAKHDVPLPNTEIKLYEHRIELLTGYYDSVKNINSRISSTPQILEKLARKLAFHLHTKNKREEDIVTLQNASIKLIAKTEGHKGAITALNELIDPCNILMPMSEDGKYGFDHLRYQEHLAAQELIFSRSIDIPLLLKNTWWRDTLVLFAQMEDDLMWLVKNVAEKKKVKMYEEGLKAMSNARPEREKIAFQDIMEKSIALETADFRSIETGTDEFYDDELDI